MSTSLGLPISQMNMIVVRGDGLVERHQFGVDQQVMMAGERLVDAGRRHAHLLQADTCTVKRSGTRMPSIG